MTDQQPDPDDPTDRHDDLREVLRAADPAAGVRPLDRAERDRLLAAAATGRPARRTAPWPVAAAAAAAVVVVGGLAWAGLSLGDDEPAPTAQQSAPSDAPTDEPSDGPLGEAVVLSLPTSSPARCMVPTAQVLDNQEVAFEGVVSEVGDDGVVLDVTTWFRGEPGGSGGSSGTVEVAAVDDRFEGLLPTPDFAEGGTYLVSASDDQVTLCGFSGAADPDLRALYERAFG